MGFLDRLFGVREAPEPEPQTSSPADDERAIEGYRYLLRTAPPETIEAVHHEAFARLTEEQRAVVYEELSKGAGTGERPLSSEPATLARAAVRVESRQPGRLEDSLGDPAYRGPGFGSDVGESLLGTVAAYVVASPLVSAFLPWRG
ncbi:MAG: hypothetical protein R2717_03425 [Schumannella sp.]